MSTMSKLGGGSLTLMGSHGDINGGGGISHIRGSVETMVKIFGGLISLMGTHGDRSSCSTSQVITHSNERRLPTAINHPGGIL